MLHEQLDNLARIGRLTAEPASKREVDRLIESGSDRLHDAMKESLNIKSRFDLAYNAAFALSLAALRRTGYRSNSRYIVFQCLEHTLDIPSEKWRILAQAHSKRNLAEYAGEYDIDTGLLNGLIRTARFTANRLTANIE